MENTRFNSPSIPTSLGGIKAADIKVNYGPDLPSDQEVVEYFNKRRPEYLAHNSTRRGVESSTERSLGCLRQC